MCTSTVSVQTRWSPCSWCRLGAGCCLHLRGPLRIWLAALVLAVALPPITPCQDRTYPGWSTECACGGLCSDFLSEARSGVVWAHQVRSVPRRTLSHVVQRITSPSTLCGACRWTSTTLGFMLRSWLARHASHQLSHRLQPPAIQLLKQSSALSSRACVRWQTKPSEGLHVWQVPEAAAAGAGLSHRGARGLHDELCRLRWMWRVRRRRDGAPQLKARAAPS